MPIFNGTPLGGGMDTSDATMTAADLLEGKTGYAKEKKIVGTLKQKEYPDFVTDATAIPEDVASGKIFYNNTGKQEGTAVIADCDLTGCMEFIPNSAVATGSYRDTVNVNVSYSAKKGITVTAYPESGVTVNGKLMTIRPSSIVAFKVNGDIVPCNITLANGDNKLRKGVRLGLTYGDGIGCAFAVIISNSSAYGEDWYLISESDAMTIYYR